jgi:hypothetical protein
VMTSSMAMIHHNAPGPMLSSASSPVTSKSDLHQRSGGAQMISDYSPEWSWADVSDETTRKLLRLLLAKVRAYLRTILNYLVKTSRTF